MKKDVNGKIVEMTEDEIKALNEENVDMPPTEEERLEALESALMELVGVIING